MPGIEDFNEQVSKRALHAQFAAQEAGGFSFQTISGSIYRQSIDIANSGAELVDKLIAINFDHLALYLEADVPITAHAFNDLRVLDSDERTALPFYVEDPMSHQTWVFVRITIPASGTKRIFFDFGNVALPSLSDSSVLGDAVFKDKAIHVRSSASLDGESKVVRDYQDGDTVEWVNNYAKKSQSFITRNATPTEAYTHRLDSGLWSYRNDGTKKMITNFEMEAQRDLSSTKFSIFAVAKASSVLNYNSIFRIQSGTDYVVFPHAATGDFIIQQDGGNVAFGCGLVPNQINIFSGHWQQNTTNGFRTYNNGTLVNQKNAANVNLTYSTNVIGLGYWVETNSQIFNGDLYELIYFKDALLDETERNEVYEYLNAKYKQYGGLENLTVTINAKNKIFSATNDENIYEFSNVGKQAWQNKVLDIELDTAALITAGRMRSDCGDIRVFDEKGIPLPYFILQPNTAKTKIIFKIPNIEAGETFQIKVTYNVPGRSSGENKAAVMPSAMSGANAVLLVDSTDYTAGTWTNQAGENLINATTAEQPTLVSDQLNGLPVVRFDGVDDWLTTSDQTLDLKSNTEISTFAVGKSNGAQGLQSLTNWEQTEFMLFPHGGPGQFYHSDNPDRPATNYQQGVFTIIGARYNAATGDIDAYRDQVLSDTRSNANSNTFPLNDTFKMGKRNFGGELTNADIASVFVTSSLLSDSDIQQIIEYYAARYHMFDEVWLTYSLVSSTQDVANSGFTYEDWSPMARPNSIYSSNYSLFGLSETTAKCDVLPIHFNPLASCTDIEQYSRSTLSHEQKTAAYNERKLEITSTSNPDISYVGGYYSRTRNRASLSEYHIDNEVQATQYRVDDTDLFTIRMHLEDLGNIDYTNSKIRLYNDNTISSTTSNWTIANEWGQFQFGIDDPFGGNNAMRLTPNAAGGFLKVWDIARHPEFTGIRTISVYVRHQSARAIVLTAYGDNFAGQRKAFSDPAKAGQWQHLTITTIDGINYNNIAIWGEGPSWQVADGTVDVFAPTSVAGTLPSSIPGSCDYSITLADRENEFFVQGLNELKFRKSKFTGSGSWNEVAFMSVDIVKNAGTSAQTLYYSEPAVIKDYDQDPKLQGGSLVSLNTSVSVDNGQNYFTKNEANLVLRKKYISDIHSFDLVDPLFFIKGLKFSDLPSWYDDCVFDFYETPKADQYNLIRFFLYKVLCFVFPAEKIDTQFLIFTGDVEFGGTRGNFPQSMYYSLRSSDSVDELISTICKSLLCTIVFDTESGKIRVRSARETFNKLNNIYNNYKVIDSVLEYNNDTQQNSQIINAFTQTQYAAFLNRSQDPASKRAYFGNIATLSAFEPTAGSTRSLFIPIADILSIPNAEHLWVQNIDIGGMLFTDTPSFDGPFNNAGVIIRDIQLVGDSIKLLYINNNTTPRYIAAMTLSAIFQHHDFLTSYSFREVEGFTGTLPWNVDFGDNLGLDRQNDESVKKYGKQEADLDFRFVSSFVATYEASGVRNARRIIPEAYYKVPDEDYSLVELYGDSDIIDKLTCMNNSNYTIGDQVIYSDQERYQRIGIVIETFVSDFTIQLTIKRIK